MKIPLTPHGTRELLLATLGCAALGAGLFLVAPVLVLIPIALWIFVISFFRDPERAAPSEPDVLVSPADGTVSDIMEVSDPPMIEEPCLRVGIFLSVFNVHVNRSPMDAQVTGLRYRPGRFLDARDERCGQENEAQEILLSGRFPIVIRQIAGLIARRIICPLKNGDQLRRGERMGMIKFGSRTELLVPLRVRPEALVKIGDKVRGSATALVRVAPPDDTP